MQGDSRLSARFVARFEFSTTVAPRRTEKPTTAPEELNGSRNDWDDDDGDDAGDNDSYERLRRLMAMILIMTVMMLVVVTMVMEKLMTVLLYLCGT